LLASMVKLEMNRLLWRWQAIVAFLFMILFFMQGYQAYTPNNYVRALPGHNGWMAFLYVVGNGPRALFPLVIPLVLPFIAGDSLAYDRRYGFDRATLLRIPYRTYILSKMISASVVSFLFVAISQLVLFIYISIQFDLPMQIRRDWALFPSYAAEWFLSFPFLYILLIIFNTSLLAMVISMVSVMLSNISKNVYLVLATPFLSFFVLHHFFYTMEWSRLAPFNLVGGYMLGEFPTYLIPLIWFVSWLLFGGFAFYFYHRKFSQGRDGYDDQAG
jgi:hypothetical protein